jgi:tetratricopeptide (TPR) repeat protein
MSDPHADIVAAGRRHGLVLLVGAGISVPAPSCLPGWTDFNDAVLDGLARRAEKLTGGQLPAGETMFGLRTVRDKMGALPIDFQAQLMHEECGAKYFKVLQTIDTEVTNGCHTAISSLAAAGLLKAIVTTNFDHLLERALDARDVPYKRFRRPEDFETLEQELGTGGALLLIKVHGSADDPNSMVDTLQQRLLGRPESLVRPLQELFARHALLIAGFSGADLAYDREYLGLRAGARRCAFVRVLTRRGKDPLPVMSALIAECPNAQAIPSDLPAALISLCSALGADVPALPALLADAEKAIRAERLGALRDGVGRWLDTVGDLSAINILSAVFEGATTTAAFILLKETRSRVLRAPDRTSASYWRYQVNLGRHLLERGYLGQDLPLGPTAAALQVGEHAGEEFDDAFRILTRATLQGRKDAAALLARLHAYRGEYLAATAIMKRFRDAALAEGHPLAMAENIISAATVHTLIGNWSLGLEWLELYYPIAKRNGDEPRRARICAHLGRFLAWAERYDEGECILREGIAIAEKLRIGLVLAELHAAWGYLELDRGRGAEAIQHLLPASRQFMKAELTSPLLPILLDLSEAAFIANQNDLSQQALDTFEDEIDRYPGLSGHYHHRVAKMLSLCGKFTEARASLQLARAAGKAMGNDWVVMAADNIEERIRGRADRPPSA